MMTNNITTNSDYSDGRGKRNSISITRPNNRDFCFPLPPYRQFKLYSKYISTSVRVEFLRCNTHGFHLTGGRYNEATTGRRKYNNKRNCVENWQFRGGFTV